MDMDMFEEIKNTHREQLSLTIPQVKWIIAELEKERADNARLRNIERAAIMVDESSESDDLETLLAYIAGLHVVLKDNPRPDEDP